MSFDSRRLRAGSRAKTHVPGGTRSRPALQLGRHRLRAGRGRHPGMFNNRPIIVGVLTLGYATLGLVFARRRHPRGPAAPVRQRWRRRAGAARSPGLLAAAMVALLPIADEPRQSADRFSSSLDQAALQHADLRHPAARLGAYCLAAARRACLAAAGALLVELPGPVRRPLAGGLDRERARRPVPGADPADSRQQHATTKPLHDLLYTCTGLKLRGRDHHLRRGGCRDGALRHDREQIVEARRSPRRRPDAAHPLGLCLPPPSCSSRCSRSMPAISSARCC